MVPAPQNLEGLSTKHCLQPLADLWTGYDRLLFLPFLFFIFIFFEN